jgi:hypothetical protein
MNPAETALSPLVAGFLLGIIFATSMVAGLFFLKFWRRTGDLLFLAFAAGFLIEGFNRLRFLFTEHPNEGTPSIYFVRLVAFALIIAAIFAKNRSAPR